MMPVALKTGQESKGVVWTLGEDYGVYSKFY
jgi:hypothetical protein